MEVFPNRIHTPPLPLPQHCNRFRLILSLFVIVCMMQLLKLPGLCSKERGLDDEIGCIFSHPKYFALCCLTEIITVYSTVCKYLHINIFSADGLVLLRIGLEMNQ